MSVSYTHLVIAVAIFMVLPYLLSNLLKPFVPGRFARTVIEGIVRIVLFIAYILLISKMKDIQRDVYKRQHQFCLTREI